MTEIPKQVQDKLAQFQTIQEQMQLLGMQKQQLLVQSTDIESALTELGKLKKGEKVYRIVGPLLVETTKDESEKALTDDKEVNSTRMKVLDKQEKKLSEKFNELRGDIQGMLKPKGSA